MLKEHCTETVARASLGGAPDVIEMIKFAVSRIFKSSSNGFRIFYILTVCNSEEGEFPFR